MFQYTAYGLGIHSAVKLPGLIPEAATADVSICRGMVHRTSSDLEDWEDPLLRVDPAEVCYFTPNLGAVMVRKGREIIVDVNAELEERVLGQFILGLPLPMLLHQRGLLVLHASAVAIDGVAIAFLGPSGQGKSTTAAALRRPDRPLITDDALVIEMEGESPIRVFPSYPQLRLWPTSVTSLGEAPEALPSVYPDTDKRSRSVVGEFCDRALPLGRIYVLDIGEDLAIEALKPTEAFQAITNQSYPTTDVSKAMGLAEAKFQQCIQLVRRVPVRRLTRSQDLSALSDLVELVENDL